MRYETTDPTDKTRAQINLDKVKARDEMQKKVYELKINRTTSIMVSKKRFNRQYAEECRDRIEGSQSVRSR